MPGLLKSLIEKVEEIFKDESSKEQIRRESLFRIIGPQIENWTTYGDIVDIVKQKVPEMYKWKEGLCRYISLEFMNDLNSLFLDKSYITETKHFRPNIYSPYYTAYKISDLGRAILRS